MQETGNECSSPGGALKYIGLIVRLLRHNTSIQQRFQEMYALHQKEAAFFTASRCMQITQLTDAWVCRTGNNRHRMNCLRNSLQCRFDQRAESILILHSHFSENFAVYSDIGSMNSVHQLTVAHAVHTCRSINARNPEAAHIPFAITAVTVHIGH